MGSHFSKGEAEAKQPAGVVGHVVERVLIEVGDGLAQARLHSIVEDSEIVRAAGPASAQALILGGKRPVGNERFEVGEEARQGRHSHAASMQSCQCFWVLRIRSSSSISTVIALCLGTVCAYSMARFRTG